MRDGIKIREDAIMIQEDDIKDTDKSIELEITKSSFALAFEGILLTQALAFVSTKPLAFQAVYFLVVVVAIIITFLNIFSRKVSSHTNVDELFIRKNAYDNWETYLDFKHLRLTQVKESLKDLLKIKVLITKLAFSLISLSLLILIVGVFT